MTKYRKEPLPVDRGWAWVVAISVFLMVFILVTGLQLDSVGFLDMVEELDTSVTILASSITANVFAVSISSLISVNVLVPRFGERPVVAIASFGVACGSLGMSNAPNVIVYVMFALLKGASSGFCFIPSVALVVLYFEKRRSLATSIGICGSSVSVICTPPLIRIGITEFGVRGCYMLLAGLELNLIALAMLLRPLSSYGPPLLDESEKNSRETKENDDTEMQLLEHKTNGENLQEKLDHDPPGDDKKSRENSIARIEKGSLLEMDAEVERSDNQEATDVVEGHKKKARACATLRNVFDFTLFREWRFCCMMVGDTLASAEGYIPLYFPTMLVMQGATKDEAAILVTIMGCLDLAGRLFAGFVADHIRPTRVTASMVFGLAVICHISPFLTSFKTMIVMSVAIGFFLDIRMSLSPVIYLEIMGTDRMSKAFSFSNFVDSCGAAAHSAFLSAVMDKTGTAQIVWHYIGCVLIFYATLLLCLPLIQRIERKVKARKKNKKTSYEITSTSSAKQEVARLTNKEPELDVDRTQTIGAIKRVSLC